MLLMGENFLEGKVYHERHIHKKVAMVGRKLAKTETFKTY